MYGVSAVERLNPVELQNVRCRASHGCLNLDAVSLQGEMAEAGPWNQYQRLLIKTQVKGNTIYITGDLKKNKNNALKAMQD